MRRMTAIATAMFVAVLGALTMDVTAQDFNSQEKTFLTFSGPVEIPGKTLPAGTYTFKLADTPGRNVVQVMSRDEKTVHGQFLFVPATRRDSTGETVVTFRETAEGATPAVHYWYYPGETIGKEFVYPKDQAITIAARTNSTVLSTDGEVTPQSQVASVDQSGRVTPWEREQAAAAPQADTVAAQPQTQPTAQPAAPVEVAAQTAVGTSGVTSGVQAEGQVAASELPRTASPLALSGLMGLLSLAGGLGLRAYRK